MPKETLNQLVKIENSPIRDAYLLLGANSPLDLSNKYTEQDQVLFKSGAWDYDNPELKVNRVKDELEKIGIENLSGEEKVWANEILWFWNHHAISCAIAKKDIEKAKNYASEALKYQRNDKDHPNKITKLLYLLVNNRLEEGKVYAQNEIPEEVERETAHHLIDSYKKNWEGF